MCKRIACVVVLLLVPLLFSSASAELVVHWRLDEGSGTTAYDSSGNGYDGTFAGTPEWVEGRLSLGAVHFLEEGQGIRYRLDADQAWPTGSVALWAKPDTLAQPQYSSVFSGYNPSGTGFQIDTDGGDPGVYRTNPQTGNQFGPVTLDWVHLALTWEGEIGSYYYNGELATTGTLTAGDTTFNKFEVGNNRNEVNSFIGVIDDFRAYDHALSEVEVLSAMSGQPWPYAYAPSPEDGAIHEDIWISLSWKPGDLAVSHDVYLGENFEEVDSEAEGTFRGNQTDTSLVIGFPGFPYPDGLVPGTTYYWRVDEVNDAEPNSPWKGPIWSFMIPPYTAYNPKPPNGAESVALDVTLSWAGGFAAKLHTTYFGDNFDDVNNASGGPLLADLRFTPPGPLELAKTYYWRVDEFNPPFTYKGDVWSFRTEGTAANPNPAKGAVDVSPTPILRWTAGNLAASHEVYFGTDADAVANATTASPEHKGTKALGEESYETGRLDLETTYYWRIDEVNSTQSGSPWIGNVWNFTTGDFLVVDDFEAYNDIDPPDPASNRIFESWIDGFGTTDNGALVGNDLPPYAEQTVVHSGNQSMPYFYDNNLKTSEATLTLVYPRDWTEEGVTKLSLWFRGASGNAADKMYVTLNGTSVVYHDNPAATQKTGWNQWVIDLTAFTGVDLTNVNTVTIGTGTKGSPAAGGTGTIYFDDIRLIR